MTSYVHFKPGQQPLFWEKPMSKDQELVLCIRRESLMRMMGAGTLEVNEFVQTKEWIKSFLQTNKEFSFIPRGQCETDDSYQQIIPYLVVGVNEEDEYRVLSYHRTKKSGDTRLRGNKSIGFGGHINPIDIADTFFDLFLNAIRRELTEELHIVDFEKVNFSILGVVKNVDDEVGKVHFGIVIGIELQNRSQLPMQPMDEVKDLKWEVSYEIDSGAKMERWSTLIYESKINFLKDQVYLEKHFVNSIGAQEATNLVQSKEEPFNPLIGSPTFALHRTDEGERYAIIKLSPEGNDEQTNLARRAMKWYAHQTYYQEEPVKSNGKEVESWIQAIEDDIRSKAGPTPKETN